MTGIICAMQIEADGIASGMENKKIEQISGMTFISGIICGKEAVLCVCGIGKVFAAVCAQTMIIKYSVNELINVGVAGSLTSELHVFDIALGEQLCQHDMDTSAIGDDVGLISGINIINIPSSPRMNEKLERCILDSELNYRKGIIASGDQFIASKEKKEYIKNTFNAIACEMEGAAVAHVCYINRVDFSVLRAISDEEGGDYEKFASLAAQNSAKIIRKYFETE